MTVIGGREKAAAPGGTADAWRYLAFAVTVGISLGIAASTVANLPEIINQWGEDYQWFRDVAHRWLDTSQFYNPHQLAGPYEAQSAVDVLYPPVVLYLFVPFTVLPAPFWWLIPIGIMVWHVASSRPAWWTWPFIAALLWFPRSQSMVIWGSTGIWVAALVALALRFPFFGSWVLVKPTFVPFALIDARRRSWWLGLAVFCAASIVMLPLWFDYVMAMRNNVGDWPPGLAYSLPDYLLVVVPIVVWVGRTPYTTRSKRSTSQ